MRVQGGPDISPNVRPQPLKIFDGLGGQNYRERHFGYNIARMVRRQIRVLAGAFGQFPLGCPGEAAQLRCGGILSYHHWSLIWCSHVEQAQLHAFGSLPAIDRERSRRVQHLAAMRGERVAEFLSD